MEANSGPGAARATVDKLPEAYRGPAPDPTNARRIEHAFRVLSWAQLSLLAAANEALAHQATLYASAEDLPLLLGCMAGLALLGAWLQARHGLLPPALWLVLLGTSLGAFAPLAYWVYPWQTTSHVLAWALPCALAFTWGAATRAQVPLLRGLWSLGLPRYLLRLDRFTLVLAVALFGLVTLPRLGTLVSAWTVALALGLSAMLLPAAERYLADPPTPLGYLPSRVLCFGAALLIVFGTPEASRPRLLGQAGTILSAGQTPLHRYAVLRQAGSVQLLVDGAVKVPGHFGYRYYQALAAPALVDPSPRQVLVLSVGDVGTVNQLLSSGSVSKLTLVYEDEVLLRVSRRIHGTLSHPQVDVEEHLDEALPWLMAHPKRYDLIAVDLLDPTNHRIGKHYTVAFYEALREHLAPNGKCVLQATSPLKSPESFAHIQATLRAAGLEPSAFVVPIPGLGAWGFVVAQPRLAPTLPAQLAKNLGLEPADELADEASPVEASRLYDQEIVRLFSEEASHAAYAW